MLVDKGCRGPQALPASPFPCPVLLYQPLRDSMDDDQKALVLWQICAVDSRTRDKIHYHGQKGTDFI